MRSEQMSEKELAEWLTAQAVKARLNNMQCLNIRVRTGVGFYARFAEWSFATGEITLAAKTPTVGKTPNGVRLPKKARVVTLAEICVKLTGRKIEVRGEPHCYIDPPTAAAAEGALIAARIEAARLASLHKDGGKA